MVSMYKVLSTLGLVKPSTISYVVPEAGGLTALHLSSSAEFAECKTNETPEAEVVHITLEVKSQAAPLLIFTVILLLSPVIMTKSPVKVMVIVVTAE